MLISPRHSEILKLIRRHGRVTVDDLVDRFSVSSQTIRKDLEALSRRNQVMRFHGGAMLPSGVVNLEYEKRRHLAHTEKDMIGKAVAGLIPDNASVFLNVGTTTEAVGNHLRGHKNLMVIADNVNVANVLRINPGLEVIIAGGVVRSSDGAIVGEAAVDFVRQFKVDYAIIGVSAIDGDGSLMDFDFREVKVAQAIMANARNIVLAADSTKFERTAPVRIAGIQEVDFFVTDYCSNEDVRKICDSCDIGLIETQN
ncbi:MAG: DeoR/GlpR family DNA-binding transcription regulator [Pseudomonadota bacterium]